MISFQKNIASRIKKFEDLLGLSFTIFLSTATIVVILGIYVANLLFGNYSLEVLQGLKDENKNLQIEIETLKQENATLHKTYLEWSDAK